jgi:hypothetical protein
MQLLSPYHRKQLLTRQYVQYIESENHCFETLFSYLVRYPPFSKVPGVYFHIPVEDQQKRLDAYSARILKKLPFVETAITTVNTLTLDSVGDLERLSLGGCKVRRAGLTVTGKGVCTLKLGCLTHILFRSKYKLTFELTELVAVLKYIADSTVDTLTIKTPYWSSDVMGKFLRQAKNLCHITVYPKWVSDHPPPFPTYVMREYLLLETRLPLPTLPIELTLEIMEGMGECVLDTVFQNRIVISIATEDTFEWYSLLLRQSSFDISGLDRVSVGIDESTTEMLSLMETLGKLPIRELDIMYTLPGNFISPEIADLETHGIDHVLNNPHIRVLSICFNGSAEPPVINHIIRHLNDTRNAANLVSLDLVFSWDSVGPFDACWVPNGDSVLLSTFCELIRDSNLEEVRIASGCPTSNHELFDACAEEDDIFSDMLRNHKTLRRFTCDVSFSSARLRQIVDAFSSNPNILELGIELDAQQYEDDISSDLILAHIAHWEIHCRAYQQSVHLGMYMTSLRSRMRNVYDPRLSALVMSYTREHYYI